MFLYYCITLYFSFHQYHTEAEESLISGVLPLNPTLFYMFLVVEEVGAPARNLRRHRENMQIKLHKQNLDLLAEARVLTAAPSFEF